MTAPHIVDPAGLLGEALAEASPDLMRDSLEEGRVDGDGNEYVRLIQEREQLATVANAVRRSAILDKPPRPPRIDAPSVAERLRFARAAWGFHDRIGFDRRAYLAFLRRRAGKWDRAVRLHADLMSPERAEEHRAMVDSIRHEIH